MNEIIITDENFEKEVIKSDKPVLIDFWATWCGPCRMIAPVVAEIAEEYADKVKVGKVNVDEQPQLAASFNIASIPTLLIIKDGRITDTVIGYRSKEQLVKLLEQSVFG